MDGSGEPAGEVVNEVALAAEIASDRKSASIVAAGRNPDTGKVVVDLVFHGAPRDCARRLDELQIKHEPVTIVVDGRSQSVTLIPELKELGVIAVQPTTGEVAAAHGQFLDLVTDGGLEHLDQPPLTKAVSDALARPLAGAQAIDRRNTADQSPLIAAELAVWGFLGWERVATPGAFSL